MFSIILKIFITVDYEQIRTEGRGKTLRKVKIGIIGCGNISRYGNGPGYMECKGAEVTAVCDSIAGRAKECMSLWGARRFYTDYRELLRDDEVEAVDVCLPNHMHARVAVETAEAGKHVAVQKPMALDVKECDAMIRAARNARVKLMAEECEIFYPPYVKVKELVAEGRIGDPVMLQMALQMASMPPKEYEKRRIEAPQEAEMNLAWRGDRMRYGGFLFDVVWHKYALAYHLFGPVGKVDAWVDNFERETPATVMWKHETNEHGVMSVVHTPGMHANCEFLRYPLPATVEVIGSKGIVWATRSEGQTIRVAPTVMYDGEYPGKTIYFDNVEAEYFAGFRNMTSHFVECVLKDETPTLTGEDGKKILQFALAVYKSALEGRTVSPSSITEWSWKDIQNKPSTSPEKLGIEQ